MQQQTTYASVFDRNAKKILFAVIIISFATTVILIEFALRLTSLRGLLITPTVSQYYNQPSKEMGYDLAENFNDGTHIFADGSHKIFTNNLGCFDKKLEDKERKDDYVLVLGDSFAWGYVPLEFNWSTVLEDILRIRVLKCGVNGFGTEQSLLKGKKILNRMDKNPTLIIVSYYINDLNDDYYLPDTVMNGYRFSQVKRANLSNGEVDYYTNEDLVSRLRSYLAHGNPDYHIQGIGQRLRYWIKRNSILAHMFKLSMQKLRVGADPPISVDHRYGFLLATLDEDKHPWVGKAWEIHRHNLQRLKQLSQSVNAHLLLIVIPTKQQVDSVGSAGISDAHNVAYRKVMTFLESQGIDYFDLLEPLRQQAQYGITPMSKSNKEFYWKYDGHWNVQGNKVAGSLVGQFIKDKGLLPSKYSVSVERAESTAMSRR